MITQSLRMPTVSVYGLLSTYLLISSQSIASTSDGNTEGNKPSTSSGVASCELLVNARFNEGAPRDYFYITNNSTPQWSITEFLLDLEPSAGRLIFDTHAGGDGVDVYQLFEVSEGSAEMNTATLPDDGGSQLQVSFTRFGAGDTFSFSIDVDDQLVDSSLGQIRVAGAEIAGSVVQVNLVNGQGEQRTQQLRFHVDSTTQIAVSGCLD